MRIRVRSYDPTTLVDWDRFVDNSNEGTLFHRLVFLRYHGDRFRQNEHHLIWNKGTTLFGVMPMAVFDQPDGRVASSPFGASYGGPVFARLLDYNDSCQVVETMLDHLAENRVTSCVLTLPIACCHTRYSETFRLALLENGFGTTNRDISSVVYLDCGKPMAEAMDSRARNMARKASKVGVECVHRGSVADFWIVMEKTFEKHGAQPTHTIDEFQWLCEQLPEHVYVDVAYLNGVPIAGIGFFVINRRVNSSFYLCQNPQYQASQALSLLISEALIRDQRTGLRWFDFGTSSTNMRGRANLFHFKESFGAIGQFRETYKWEAK